MYQYTALVLSVYDADTLTVEVDLGFHVKIKQTLRLSRINAPEVTGDTKQLGLDARDYVRRQILGKRVTICTEKDKQEKFGRYLAEVIYNEVCLNDELVALSLAVYQKY